MQRNLKAIFMRVERMGTRAAGACERLVFLLPDAPDERRDRGTVYEQLGCFKAATNDAPALRISKCSPTRPIRRTHPQSLVGDHPARGDAALDRKPRRLKVVLWGCQPLIPSLRSLRPQSGPVDFAFGWSPTGICVVGAGAPLAARAHPALLFSFTLLWG